MRTPTTRRKFLGLTTSAAASTWAGAGLFAAGASASPDPKTTVYKRILRPETARPGGAAPNARQVSASRGKGCDAYKDFRKLLARSDIDADHVRSFLDAVKSRKDPIEPVEVGHSTASLCILGNIAQLLKRKFTWDPAAERSTDEEVNRMLQRPMRAPWKLP